MTVDNADRIRPWGKNPRYWQYKRRPVLLVGGSREDNLFQIADLETHLDLLVSCGGNFLRNTMSDRDPGDVHAWARRENGKYDLDTPNEEYWQRFGHFLELTAERDVIVQIEVWDRFDLSRAPWREHPLNPRNAVSTLPADVGLAEEYPKHPGQNVQPFFFTVPHMPGYDPKLDPLRRVQEAYVDELLSHSLSFGNVLYCMNNETSGPPEWGLYWMSHIRRRAAEAGVDVCVTDMFDDAWRPEESKSFLRVLDEPETYDFVEISQVNSRNFGNDHWRRICWVTESAHVDRPRPVNHTKIYSDGNTGFGSGYPQDGVERFWHNLLAGSAAVRFHRPPAGIALNPLAQACIRSARIVERMVPFWTLRPDDGVVPGGSENGLAYAAVAEDGMAVVFLPRGVAVDALWTRSERVRVDWISVATGARIGVETLEADGELTLKPRLAGPTVAVLRPAP